MQISIRYRSVTSEPNKKTIRKGVERSFETFFQGADMSPFGLLTLRILEDRIHGGDASTPIKATHIGGEHIQAQGFPVRVYLEGRYSTLGHLSCEHTDQEAKLESWIQNGVPPAKKPPSKKVVAQPTKGLQSPAPEVCAQVGTIPQFVKSEAPKQNSLNDEDTLMKKLEELKKAAEATSAQRNTLRDEIARVEKNVLPGLAEAVRVSGAELRVAQHKHDTAQQTLTDARAKIDAKKKELEKLAVPQKTQEEIRQLLKQAQELAEMAGITA